MTPIEWLASATNDIEHRNLAELRPLLEGLARSTAVLRAADWNADASGGADVRSDGTDAA